MKLIPIEEYQSVDSQKSNLIPIEDYQPADSQKLNLIPAEDYQPRLIPIEQYQAEPPKESSFFGTVEEEDLKKDPEFIKAAKSIYKWNEGRTLGFKNKEPKKLNSDEQYADYALRYMGWFNYNIPKMGKEIADLKHDATEQQKNDFVTLMDKYDQKKVSLAGTGRFATGVLTDPSTYFGITTLGAGLAARETAKAAAKRSVREMVKSGLKVGGTIGAVEGAAYTALDDRLRQSARIQAGQQEGYDFGQGAKAATMGATLGGVLGGSVGALSGKVKGGKIVRFEDSVDKQLVELGLDPQEARQAQTPDPWAKPIEIKDPTKRAKQIKENIEQQQRYEAGRLKESVAEKPEINFQPGTLGDLVISDPQQYIKEVYNVDAPDVSYPKLKIIKIDDGQTDQPRYNLVQNISIKDAYDDATLSNLTRTNKLSEEDLINIKEDVIIDIDFATLDEAKIFANETVEDIRAKQPRIETPKPKGKSKALPESLKAPPKPKVRRARDYIVKGIGKDFDQMGEMNQALEGKGGQIPPAYRARSGERGAQYADEFIEKMQDDGFYPPETVKGGFGTTKGEADSFYDDIAIDRVHKDDQLELDIYNQRLEEIEVNKKLLKEYNVDARGMSDEDLAKTLYEIQSGEMPPSRVREDVPIGEYEGTIARTDEPGLSAIDFQKDTTTALNQKIIDVGTQIMDELDIPMNPKVRISDQIKEAILLANENKTYRDKFAEVLVRNNLTVDQLSGFFRESVADSARRMQQLSAVKQSLKKIGQDLGQIEKEEGFYSNFIDSYSDTIRALDNIRRGLLVSQIATAMRNNTAQIGRVMLNTLVQAFDGALNQTFNPVRRAFGSKEQIVDHTKSFRLFMNLTKNKSKAKDLTEFLTKYYVNEGDKLFTKYASEVADSSKAKVFKGAQKAVDGLNFLNRMQEFYYRRGMFATSIQNTLAEKGIDINKIGIGDDLLDYISADDVSKAVDDALYFTYAKTPDNEMLRGFVNLMNKYPFLTTAVFPFARFMANAVEFQFKHSPAGFGMLLRQKERAKIASGDTSAFSQAMIGSTLLLATLEAKRRGAEDQKWYEVQTSTGKTVDMRPYFPLTPYLFVADVITRLESGRSWGDAKDILQALTGAQFRAGAALGFVNNLLNGLSGLDTQEKINKYMSDFVADVLGGFATPLRMFNDFIDQEQEFRRPESTGEFWPDLGNQLLMNVPVARDKFPEVESPTRIATPGRPDFVTVPFTDQEVYGPLARQLTGITVIEEKNVAEREFDRLGYKMRDILPYSGNRKVDQTRAKYLGEWVEKAIAPAISSPGYQGLTNAQKNILLREMLKSARASADDYIKVNRINELEFQKAAFNRQSKATKDFLREGGITWESLQAKLKE
jgi:hypothetical protein